MFTPTWQASDLARATPTLDTWVTLYRLPRAVVFGLVAMESNFKPNAIRQEPKINDASYGLTQILYRTAQGLGYRGTTTGLFVPDTNVQYGLLYLRQMLDRVGAVDKALSAYNGGLFSGTIHNQSYVDGVLARAEYFNAAWAPVVLPDQVVTDSANEGLPWWIVIGLGALIGLGVFYGSK